MELASIVTLDTLLMQARDIVSRSNQLPQPSTQDLPVMNIKCFLLMELSVKTAHHTPELRTTINFVLPILVDPIKFQIMREGANINAHQEHKLT